MWCATRTRTPPGCTVRAGMNQVRRAGQGEIGGTPGCIPVGKESALPSCMFGPLRFPSKGVCFPKLRRWWGEDWKDFPKYKAGGNWDVFWPEENRVRDGHYYYYFLNTEKMSLRAAAWGTLGMQGKESGVSQTEGSMKKQPSKGETQVPVIPRSHDITLRMHYPTTE